MEVHTGGNYEAVVLPDGSQEYMNHQSSITVNLSGEAFFTVKPNESTFTVSTTHGDIEVLGTEFNVKSTTELCTVTLKNIGIPLKNL